MLVVVDHFAVAAGDLHLPVVDPLLGRVARYQPDFLKRVMDRSFVAVTRCVGDGQMQNVGSVLAAKPEIAFDLLAERIDIPNESGDEFMQTFVEN